MTRAEALKRAEKKADDRINFVTTHSSYLPNVNKILRRHSHFLGGRTGQIHQRDPEIKSEEREKPGRFGRKRKGEGEGGIIGPMWKRMQALQIYERDKGGEG